MEEVVWKDIDDLGFHHNHHLTTTNSVTAAMAPHCASLLDFLSTPATPPQNTTRHQFPVTTLSLNLGPNMQVDINNNRPKAAGVGATPSSCKRRPRQNKVETSDQRHERLAKNRESSARCRAKKQAYTDSLEIEVASLKKENARLRRQLEKLYQATTVDNNMKQLHRTFTAPF